MSIFKLKNKTGSDSLQTWANSFTFPNNIAIDLCDPGTYGSPPTEYSIGMSYVDLIGVKSGSCFNSLAALLRTGLWKMNDGDRDLTLDEGLHLVKYGMPLIYKAKPEFSGRSYAAFESHNMMNPSEWPNGESKYTITPTSGKVLHLINTKTIVSLDSSATDVLYFRIYVGATKAKENLYPNVTQLLLGASAISSSPQIGNPATTGALQLCHIMYQYAEPIDIKSSLGMRLEIGMVSDIHPDKEAMLRVRVEAISENE